MAIRSILVPSSEKLDLSANLEAARSIAQPLKAHIDVLRIAPSSSSLKELSFGPGFDASAAQAHLRSASRLAKREFEAWCDENRIGHRAVDHLLGSTFARWIEIEAEVETAVAREGRLHDLIVISKHAGSLSEFSRCFDAAVFSAGRPTFVAPKGTLEQPLRHVLIAWNGSLEAMHSVALSLDLIHQAERVSVLSLGTRESSESSAEDLASALRWHGVSADAVDANVEPQEQKPEALMGRAHDMEASLVIMGAFTHSRIRETLLGGFTEYLLSHAEMPVIFTH